MAVMYEFKQARETMKNSTFKEKLAYFWCYYKWYVIVPVVAAVFLTNSIYTMITGADTILRGILLNTDAGSVEDAAGNLADDFLKVKNIDNSKYDISLNTSLSYAAGEETIDTNYQVEQVIMTQSAASMLDFMVGDGDSMTEIAGTDLFVDLSELFNAEQFALYEPYILYINQVPVFIDMSQNKHFMEIYSNTTDTLVLGVTTSIENIDMTVDFIEYLME